MREYYLVRGIHSTEPSIKKVFSTKVEYETIYFFNEETRKEDHDTIKGNGYEYFHDLQDAVNRVIKVHTDYIKVLKANLASSEKKLSESQAKSLEDWIKL